MPVHHHDQSRPHDIAPESYPESVAVRRVRDRRPKGRLRAVLAAGGVLGVGAAVTLAAWTDTEWVSGGADGDGPIGTSVFEIEQNVFDGADFQNRETWPDDAVAGELTFPLAASSLSPGAVAYAPMQLRAAAGSIGGTVLLRGAQQGTGTDAPLFEALTYHARSGVPAASCNDSGMTGGTELAPAGTGLASDGSGSFTVPGAPDDDTPGAPVDVCFALTMPSSATDQGLQGLTVVPVWSFLATSQS